MRGINSSGRRRVDEENPYWISFSDLMSALLVIFILAAVALMIELTQKQKTIEEDIEELKAAEQARRDVLNEIYMELKKRNIEVVIADNDTVLRIPDNTLSFESNSDQLPKNKESLEKIKIIGEVMHRAINKYFDEAKSEIKRHELLDTVFIEGHTDSVKTNRKKGNWGLSTDRAITLWKFWQLSLELEPSFNEMVNAYGDRLFSVSGYAETRRVNLIELSNQDRRENRRIDIRFTVKRPSISQLEDIVGQ